MGTRKRCRVGGVLRPVCHLRSDRGGSGRLAPSSFASLSGRYLSFVEREEIAILHA